MNPPQIPDWLEDSLKMLEESLDERMVEGVTTCAGCGRSPTTHYHMQTRLDLCDDCAEEVRCAARDLAAYEAYLEEGHELRNVD